MENSPQHYKACPFAFSSDNPEICGSLILTSHSLEPSICENTSPTILLYSPPPVLAVYHRIKAQSHWKSTIHSTFCCLNPLHRCGRKMLILCCNPLRRNCIGNNYPVTGFVIAQQITPATLGADFNCKILMLLCKSNPFPHKAGKRFYGHEVCII